MPDRAASSTRATVALVVDHPRRDLAGLVLLALELARRGIICHLVPVNLQQREIWALAPDFVLFNFFRRSNERFARELHQAGIEFGVLDTEGAIWPDPDEYASLLWKDDALRRQARCVCMWGSRLAEHVIERGLFAPGQVAVTGCPRFDLYATQWRHLTPEIGLGPGRRPTVLINTNFSVSNPLFTTADKSVALHRDVLGYTVDRLREVVADEGRALQGFVELARNLADALPQVDVVVRPHPFEDPAPYERGIEGRPNIRVDQNAPIQAAIFGACAVIQRSCTTALESAMAGVPTFSPQWIPAPFLMPHAEAASVPLSSIAELKDAIAAIVDGSYLAPEGAGARAEAVLRECLFATDGLAHRRVADVVERVIRPAQRLDRRKCRRALYGLQPGLDRGVGLAARHLRHALGLSPEWSFRRFRAVPATGWMNSAKHFDASGVRSLVTRARELTGRPDSEELDVSGAVRQGQIAAARYGVTIRRTDAQAGCSA